MKIFTKNKIILSAILLFTTVTAQTANDAIHILGKEISFGARALAMGGAYSGLADDYTAIYWNPAGLAYLKNPEFSAELSHFSQRNQALFTGITTDDNQAYTRLRSFGIAWPLPTYSGSAVLAIGYNRIADYDDNLAFSGFSEISNGIGFDITTADDQTANYLFDENIYQQERVFSDGGLGQWSLGGAMAFSPALMGGATISVISGREKYNQHYYQEDNDNTYAAYPADFHSYEINRYLKTTVSGLELKLGGSLRLGRLLRIGGAAGLPVRFAVKEVYFEDDLLIFDDGYEDPTENTGKWEYAIRAPFYFDGGVAFTSRYLTLAASARYRDWSQTEFVVQDDQLQQEDYRDYISENYELRGNYRATTEYHLGGELRLPIVNTALRGGYARYPEKSTVVVNPRNKEVYTLGVSLQLDRNLRIDVTGLSGNWSRDSRDSLTPAGTSENITVSNLLVGLAYTF
ncbi:MAG: hypothetical protein ABIA75_11555 [Candidatus Neomarinimicrobiota bacterium]